MISNTGTEQNDDIIRMVTLVNVKEIFFIIAGKQWYDRCIGLVSPPEGDVT